MHGQNRTVEQLLALIAGQARGNVTYRELLAVGLTRGQIEHRIRKGGLIAQFPGVYRVGHVAPSFEADYMAAVKACGHGAVLAGTAAAYVYSLLKGKPPPPTVITPTQRRIRGIKTCRARSGIDPRDVTTYRGFPVTTVPRTLLDLAAILSADDLARAYHEAAVRHRTKPLHVDAVLARHPNAPRRRNLVRVAHGDEPVLLSELERRFIALLRKHGLPLPLTNRPTGGYWVDCRWPEYKLTVELVSYAFHNTRHSWEQDHERRREARARKDEFRTYTWTDVVERPGPTLEELRSLLS